MIGRTTAVVGTLTDEQALQRKIRIEGHQFEFTGTVKIKPSVDDPSMQADQFLDHLDDCLVEYIVSQATE